MALLKTIKRENGNKLCFKKLSLLKEKLKFKKAIQIKY